MSTSCICRKIIKQTQQTEMFCPAEHHNCTCKMSLNTLCLREKKSCQKRSKERRFRYVDDQRCICEYHSHNQMIYDRCKSTTGHTVCVCSSKYNENGYVCCNVDPAEHACICFTIRTPNISCLALQHVCVCLTRYTYNHQQCLAEKHFCVCGQSGRIQYSFCNAKEHVCVCLSAVPERCQYDGNHDCSCLKYSPGRCKKDSNSSEHKCICHFTLPYSNMYMAQQLIANNINECLASSHKQICICSLGLNVMQCCPSSDAHYCMCQCENKICRQHKTFQIWENWNHLNSFLYWIPEEVLSDCIEFLF